MTLMTLGAAVGAGLREALGDDPKVVLLGEDIGRLGGVYRVTSGLQRDFGPRRVVDTPLAESGILGTAVGLAYRGWRPVCEIQFDGFVYPAFDQIVSQVARMHARTSGAVRMPITIRIPVGGGIGAAEHHSDSPEAYFAHTPGLRVVSVATPQDAYDTIIDAVASDDPVVFFEPKRRYHVRGEVVTRAERATVDGTAGMGGARVVLPGSDVTLVTFGGLVQVALDAARAAAARGRLDRGRRPAVPLADRPRDRRGLGPAHRPAGRRARGARVRRARRRGRRGRGGAVLRRPRARPGPRDGLGRPVPAGTPASGTTCPTSTGSSTASTTPSASPRASTRGRRDHAVPAAGPR